MISNSSFTPFASHYKSIYLLRLKLVTNLIWTGVYPELEDASESLPELAASHAVDQEIQAENTGSIFLTTAKNLNF